MSLLVIDASIAAQWFFEEEYTSKSREIVETRHELHAPEFLLLEFDSVLWKRVRRGRVSNAIASDFRVSLRRLPIKLHPMSDLLDLSWNIARDTNCTVYDSLYVALAALLKAQVLTADRHLCEGLRDTMWKAHVKWIGDLE